MSQSCETNWITDWKVEFNEFRILRMQPPVELELGLEWVDSVVNGQYWSKLEFAAIPPSELTVPILEGEVKLGVPPDGYTDIPCIEFTWVRLPPGLDRLLTPWIDVKWMCRPPTRHILDWLYWRVFPYSRGLLQAEFRFGNTEVQMEADNGSCFCRRKYGGGPVDGLFDNLGLNPNDVRTLQSAVDERDSLRADLQQAVEEQKTLLAEIAALRAEMDVTQEELLRSKQALVSSAKDNEGMDDLRSVVDERDSLRAVVADLKRNQADERSAWSAAVDALSKEKADLQQVVESRKQLLDDRQMAVDKAWKALERIVEWAEVLTDMVGEYKEKSR